jgi:serine/threonine-protein kinase
MPTLDQFVNDLAHSRLVNSAGIAAARAAMPPGPESDAALRLARVLVEQGRLTRYQAQKVLAGVTKGFFLGGYKILKRLGAGGMGKVYLAERQSDGQVMAIKVLPPRRAAEQKQALERFQREMEISQRLNHAHIARTFEVGRDGEVYFMVMEYIPGASLYELVRSARGGPLRVPDAARLFQMVAWGLEAAHAAGLIHRDIKPSNIMITPEGEAKILDLGLAKDTTQASPLTTPNTVIGTLDYASPEQLGNAARADARSDLYSVGCTLYFALSGRAPFEGGDVVNKIYKQQMEDPPALEKVSRGCPPAFAAIVRKLMAKQPSERYQHARDLAADLAKWTDPAVVEAMLGEEARGGKAFRPPPPVFEDEDLRLLPDEGPPISVLKELGSAEPTHAPMYRPPPPPKSALVVPEAPSAEERLQELPDRGAEEMPWLKWLLIGLSVVSVLAIVLFNLFRPK